MKILLIIISLLALSIESVQAISLQDDSAAYSECNHTSLDYCDSVLTNGLEGNQTTLFYMYSNNVGHYFLDPLAMSVKNFPSCNVFWQDNQKDIVITYVGITGIGTL